MVAARDRAHPEPCRGRSGSVATRPKGRPGIPRVVRVLHAVLRRHCGPVAIAVSHRSRHVPVLHQRRVDRVGVAQGRDPARSRLVRGGIRTGLRMGDRGVDRVSPIGRTPCPRGCRRGFPRMRSGLSFSVRPSDAPCSTPSQRRSSGECCPGSGSRSLATAWPGPSPRASSGLPCWVCCFSCCPRRWPRIGSEATEDSGCKMTAAAQRARLDARSDHHLRRSLGRRPQHPFRSCSPKETGLSPRAIGAEITSCDERGCFGGEHSQPPKPRPPKPGTFFQPWRFHMGEVVQFVPKRELESGHASFERRVRYMKASSRRRPALACSRILRVDRTASSFAKADDPAFPKI